MTQTHLKSYILLLRSNVLFLGFMSFWGSDVLLFMVRCPFGSLTLSFLASDEIHFRIWCSIFNLNLFMGSNVCLFFWGEGYPVFLPQSSRCDRSGHQDITVKQMMDDCPDVEKWPDPCARLLWAWMQTQEQKKRFLFLLLKRPNVALFLSCVSRGDEDWNPKPFTNSPHPDKERVDGAGKRRVRLPLMRSFRLECLQ